METEKPPGFEQNHPLSEMRREVRALDARGASRRAWAVRALWAWGFGWAGYFAWPWVLEHVGANDIFLFLLAAFWFLIHLRPKVDSYLRRAREDRRR